MQFFLKIEFLVRRNAKKYKFCNLYYSTFVVLIQDWKHGQDKPLVCISNLVVSLVLQQTPKLFLLGLFFGLQHKKLVCESKPTIVATLEFRVNKQVVYQKMEKNPPIRTYSELYVLSIFTKKSRYSSIPTYTFIIFLLK